MDKLHKKLDGICLISLESLLVRFFHPQINSFCFGFRDWAHLGLFLF